nr:hypothetical protein [Myxococcota bacterium]
SDPSIELPRDPWDTGADHDAAAADEHAGATMSGDPLRRAVDIAARIDAALDHDEWNIETPVIAPSKAELRALLGVPDPTRKQSYDELERLHRATQEESSDPEVLLPPRRGGVTAEVDPDDIESAIELAPPARRSTIAVAKQPPAKPAK